MNPGDHKVFNYHGEATFVYMLQPGLLDWCHYLIDYPLFLLPTYPRFKPTSPQRKSFLLKNVELQTRTS